MNRVCCHLVASIVPELFRGVSEGRVKPIKRAHVRMPGHRRMESRSMALSAHYSMRGRLTDDPLWPLTAPSAAHGAGGASAHHNSVTPSPPSSSGRAY